MNKEEIDKIIDNLEGCMCMFDYLVTPTEGDLLLSYIKELRQENQELKKQLEEAQKNIILLQASELNQCWNIKKALEENQQKEFIEYLESYLKLFDNKDTSEEGYYDCIEEILSKYKEIIGGKE